MWNRQTKLGFGFNSSTRFHLANGADHSPDLAWIRKERWQALSQEEKETFAPICPDCVVELRSKSDSLKSLQEKMQEYQENGLLLGWLIDGQKQRVEIYQQGQEVEVLAKPSSLSGEETLPGFVLDLTEVWQ